MKKEKPKPKRKFRPSDNTQYLTVAGGAILVLLVTFALNEFAGPTQDTWGMVIASVGGLGVMILPLLLHIDDKGNTIDGDKIIALGLVSIICLSEILSFLKTLISTPSSLI